MGVLVDGKWTARDASVDKKTGKFVRSKTQFRNWITADGRPGPTGRGGFKAESGRYHLYVSWACPWAHRTLIFRQIKGLTDHIGLSAVHWHMGDNGWEFAPDDGVIPDPVNGADYLYEVYRQADPAYSGRVSVPVLWDKQTGTIVSNESSEIIRMFNAAFDDAGAATPADYHPADLQAEIEPINDRIYDTVNNGVYKSGFARSQAAYEEAVTALFETMDWLEDRLSRQRYLMGDRLTEADWRLFPTMARFDPVYHYHFKCNRRRLRDYPNLWGHTRELYQWPGVADTVNLFHIKQHYFGSHTSINPTGIVPTGPDIDFTAPHERDRLPAAA